jgi:hypothetical protein
VFFVVIVGCGAGLNRKESSLEEDFCEKNGRRNKDEIGQQIIH